MSGKKKIKEKNRNYLKLYLVLVLLAEIVFIGWFIAESSDVKKNIAINTAAQDKGPITLVVAGDIACDPTFPAFNGGNGTATSCHMQSTADIAKGIKPDYVLLLGDLQYYDATLSKFQASYDRSWGALRSVSKPVPGNHEYATHNASGYYDYFGQNAGLRNRGYYSYSVGSWHIIALNSNCQFVGGCQIGSPQEQWLGAELAKHKNKCTLAYWHHSLFSSGKHGNNYNVLPLWQKLAAARADVVLTGHDHIYERFSPQGINGESTPSGIVQFVVGTGGKDLYPIIKIKKNSLVRHNTSFGILKLTLDHNSYTWEFISETNQPIDAGTASCV